MTIESETEVKTKTKFKTETIIEVKKLPEFDNWIDNIKDRTNQLRLEARIDKIRCDVWGDVKRLKNDIYEIRETYGPGWRMYYFRKQNEKIIYMLYGGDKSTQKKDIVKANKIKNKCFGEFNNGQIKKSTKF